MPTTSTTSLYDSDDRVFYPFTTENAYINPYSSDRIGGELITEYNQRNALNTICKKDMNYKEYAEFIKTRLDALFGDDVIVDEDTGRIGVVSAGLYSFKDLMYADLAAWHATVYATGVRDTDDFKLSYGSGIVSLTAGKAMINGYNIESTAGCTFALTDIITQADVQDVYNTAHHQNPSTVSNPICTMFIKLALMLTTDGTHDERLNPPVNGQYMSIAIVVDDTLQRENELLLGTVTLDSNGAVYVSNNPLKTRLVPLDVIAGAEGYDELINSANMKDKHIYGLRSDAPHHITDITSKLWLDNESNLAKLLKSFSAEPETASIDPHKNTRALIVTNGPGHGEGYDDYALRHNNIATFPSLYWFQSYALEGDTKATIEQRDLYYPFAYCDDVIIHKELVPPPAGSAVKQYVYNDQFYPEISGRRGRSGYITGQQIFMLEKAYQHAANPHDAGRQYGPFLTVTDAVNWFAAHQDIDVRLEDYFWVINDVIESVQTNFGTVSGQLSGSVSGIVTGSVSGTGTVTGTVSGTAGSTPVTGEVTGTVAIGTDTPVTGNVTGVAQGTVLGKWDSFKQNVSIRYSCVYAGAGTPGTNHGVHCIADSASYVGHTQPPDDLVNPRFVEGTGTAYFVMQAVERGFSVPATSSTYGLVKVRGEKEATAASMYDVIISGTTGRLEINKPLYQMILNGGFSSTTEQLPVELTPNTTANALWNKIYQGNGLTVKLTGEASAWETASDEVKTLKHVRGHVILDFSAIEVNQDYNGGIIFKCEDVDYVTLKGDNETSSEHASTSPLRLAFDHCIVDTPFFGNIGYFKSSSFTSGSNTIELHNPWMTVDKVFQDRDYIKNKLYTRFASVTMGENGIVSAMMDMWIQYENMHADANSIDYSWSSRARIKFPPLMCEFISLDSGSVTTGSIDPKTIQHIPNDIAMKIGATAGVHEVITAQNEDSQIYTPSGNLLATVDWSYNTHYEVRGTPEEKLHLNLYMKNSSGEAMQKISNLKFRVPVLVSRNTDATSIYYATYKDMYGSDPRVTDED